MRIFYGKEVKELEREFRIGYYIGRIILRIGNLVVCKDLNDGVKNMKFCLCNRM